jgi:hypothetical protein
MGQGVRIEHQGLALLAARRGDGCADDRRSAVRPLGWSCDSNVSIMRRRHDRRARAMLLKDQPDRNSGVAAQTICRSPRKRFGRN